MPTSKVVFFYFPILPTAQPYPEKNGKQTNKKNNKDQTLQVNMDPFICHSSAFYPKCDFLPASWMEATILSHLSPWYWVDETVSSLIEPSDQIWSPSLDDRWNLTMFGWIAGSLETLYYLASFICTKIQTCISNWGQDDPGLQDVSAD